MPNIDIQNLLITILVLTFSLSTHEYAHAAVAHYLGDNTAKDLGRLTLDPLAHLDPLGALAFLIARIGWAKPVPINPANFSKAKSPKIGTMLVSLAGPVSNLLISFMAAFCFNLTRVVLAWILVSQRNELSVNPQIFELLFNIFQSFYFANIGLAIFNLLPIPPLDGSKVLAPLIPEKALRWMAVNQRYISFAFLLLFYFGGNLLGKIISTIAVPFNYVLMLPWQTLADRLIEIITTV